MHLYVPALCYTTYKHTYVHVYYVGIGCQPENDTVWGIGWHFTTAGSVAEGKCPGLSESSGNIV